MLYEVITVVANFKAGNTSETTTKEEPKVENTVSATSSANSSDTSSVNNGGRIFASPLAKKIAEEKGIDLSQVKGTGENGRIVKSDVENFTPSSVVSTPVQAVVEATQAVAAVKPFVPAGEEFREEVKNSQMRKTIARRLGESKFTAPHYYLTIELDMDNAMTSRSMINTLPDTKVSFNDMVVKACAMALKKHPQVNSQWREDAMVLNHHVHVGVAVAVEDGLVVPVFRITSYNVCYTKLLRSPEHSSICLISFDRRSLAPISRRSSTLISSIFCDSCRKEFSDTDSSSSSVFIFDSIAAILLVSVIDLHPP